MKREHFRAHASAINAAIRRGLQALKTRKPAKLAHPDQETRDAIDSAVRAGLQALCGSLEDSSSDEPTGSAPTRTNPKESAGDRMTEPRRRR